MSPKLYMTQLSPPARAVMMCARAVNVKLDLIEINLLKKDHLNPEYLKLNPVHTVPTLDDDGLILNDSHAIMGYLIDKYGEEKSLYPEDIEKRALINHKLFFDAAVLFPRHLRAALPVLFDEVKSIPEQLANDLRVAYGFIETFLQRSTYIAGNDLSIADFSVFTSLTNANVIVPLDEGKYPRIAFWKKNMKALSLSDIDQLGDEVFRSIILPKLEE